jgi:hypothetical protein
MRRTLRSRRDPSTVVFVDTFSRKRRRTQNQNRESAIFMVSDVGFCRPFLALRDQPD